MGRPRKGKRARRSATYPTDQTAATQKSSSIAVSGAQANGAPVNASVPFGSPGSSSTQNTNQSNKVAATPTNSSSQSQAAKSSGGGAAPSSIGQTQSSGNQTANSAAVSVLQLNTAPVNISVPVGSPGSSSTQNTNQSNTVSATGNGASQTQSAAQASDPCGCGGAAPSSISQSQTRGDQTANSAAVSVLQLNTAPVNIFVPFGSPGSSSTQNTNQSNTVSAAGNGASQTQSAAQWSRGCTTDCMPTTCNTSCKPSTCNTGTPGTPGTSSFLIVFQSSSTEDSDTTAPSASTSVPTLPHAGVPARLTHGGQTPWDQLAGLFLMLILLSSLFLLRRMPRLK